MSAAETAGHWLNVRQAADYMGVSEPTVFRWMREGKVSFFKLGGATRFRRENLDMVARKVTATEEAAARRTRCTACGHGYLVAGSVRSTGRVYFQPRRTRFFVLSDSLISVSASACPACGHVQMFADTGKLGGLMVQEESAASERARGEPEQEA
jgi:excisionase family DNA binding protein